MNDAERLLAEAAPERRDADGRLLVDGALTGYRAWSVGRVGGEYRLFPVFQKSEVAEPYPRGVTSAICTGGELAAPHRSPETACSCGLYAFWDLPKAAAYQGCRRHATLLGRVTAWGHVLPGTEGFRSGSSMIDAVFAPICQTSECAAAVTNWLVRPDWTAPLTPGGRTYPRVNDRRHATYRETADFVAFGPPSAYLGWYCDHHANVELIAPGHPSYVCNFPLKDSRRCRRPSAFALPNLCYSWCHEHAPLSLDARAVMKDVRSFYDLASPP